MADVTTGFFGITVAQTTDVDDGTLDAAMVTDGIAIDTDVVSLVTELVAMVIVLVVVTIVMVAALVEAVSKSKENHALFQSILKIGMLRISVYEYYFTCTKANQKY